MPMLTDFDKFIVGVVMMVIILSLSWLYLKHDDYKKDIEDHKNKKLKNFWKNDETDVNNINVGFLMEKFKKKW